MNSKDSLTQPKKLISVSVEEYKKYIATLNNSSHINTEWQFDLDGNNIAWFGNKKCVAMCIEEPTEAFASGYYILK
jgi:hypothetical protein